MKTSTLVDPVVASEAGDFAQKLEDAWQLACQTLRQERLAAGYWTGELSTSALSTATAISALAQYQLARPATAAVDGLASRPQVSEIIETACRWLVAQQNLDGGFGDTDRSHSNIATTLLVLAAWELAGQMFAAERASVCVPQPGSGRATAQAKMTREPPPVAWWSEVESCLVAAWGYVEQQGSWDGLRRRYGTDKTFVVPILTNCALAGMVSWEQVPALPFEAAWLPQTMYRWARMPVVSYAVPALVAIGQVRYHLAPPQQPLLRALRRCALQPTLEVLRKMQPDSGGYLEATPLTSFVLMSLAAAGNAHLPVARDCLRFLLASRLADGSWPIDTNLATWVTSLTLHAVSTRGDIALSTLGPSNAAPLSAAPLSAGQVSAGQVSAGQVSAGQVSAGQVSAGQVSAGQVSAGQVSAGQVSAGPLNAGDPLVDVRTVSWLLGCQHRRRHPFTGAEPGGWGWTNLSGAVPDADDTPAALLALSHCRWEQPAWLRLRQQALEGVGWGIAWLLGLQNRDGGWPTFCRGWGTLPFDRSGTDLTAHALRALHAWLPRLAEVTAACSQGPSEVRRLRLSAQTITASMRRGLDYLERMQHADGSWSPLWFGNQDRLEEDNPVYGTGKVLLAYGTLGLSETPQARRAVAFLLDQQNPDGGWGGGGSVVYVAQAQPITSTLEETAVALEGLMSSGQSPHAASIMQALDWLATMIQSGHLGRPWPIGFYFAKLWYYERLYPTIFSLGALGTALTLLATPRGARQSAVPSSP